MLNSSDFQGSLCGAGAPVFALWGYCVTENVRGFVMVNPRFVGGVLGCTEEEISIALEFLLRPEADDTVRLEKGTTGEFHYFVPGWEERIKMKAKADNRFRQHKHREKVTKAKASTKHRKDCVCPKCQKVACTPIPPAPEPEKQPEPPIEHQPDCCCKVCQPQMNVDNEV